MLFKRKYIIQYGNLAGWPYTFAKGFRNIGINSINIIPENSDTHGVSNFKKVYSRNLPYDKSVFLYTDTKVMKLLKRLFCFLKLILSAKFIHYHGGTILPYNIDTYIFKLLKIPMLISWGGGDARIISEAASLNPYFYRFEEPVKDRNIRKMLKRIGKNINYLSTDPEMTIYSTPYFKKIFPFFAPVDLTEFKCIIPEKKIKLVKFLHIPTHPFAKGTVHIKNAFKKLKKSGYEFEYCLLESNLSQKQVRQKISEFDVYVDELRVGAYGVTAVEGMACGKPVMTFIREDIVDKYPEDLPIINTNADNIYENLKYLLENSIVISEIGQKSREYVEKYHSVDKVINMMMKIYKEIGYNG